jgi:hypothetical protein
VEGARGCSGSAAGANAQIVARQTCHPADNRPGKGIVKQDFASNGAARSADKRAVAIAGDAGGKRDRKNGQDQEGAKGHGGLAGQGDLTGKPLRPKWVPKTRRPQFCPAQKAEKASPAVSGRGQ